MSRKNQNMHVVALQTTVGQLTADKLALTQALAELGYCHEQQTAFITESMSGPTGCISKETLLLEAKASLAEAVDTNKRLTGDLAYQEHRYSLLQKEVGAKGRALAGATDTIAVLETKEYWLSVSTIALGLISAIGLAYHLPGLF